MATSIEDIQAYIRQLIAGQPQFTVTTSENLFQQCWRAVWPLVERHAGEVDYSVMADPEFNQIIQTIFASYAAEQHAFDTRDRYAFRKQYPEFIFESFDLERSPRGIQATYHYVLGEHRFNPTVSISQSNISNNEISDDFLQTLFFNFGIINAINYYKLSCAPKFIIRAGQLTAEQKQFFVKLFYHGLGELMYKNELDIPFSEFLTIESEEPTEPANFKLPDNFSGNLIPVGGGKDSVVTLEALQPMHEDNLCLMYNRDIYPIDHAAINCIKLAGYSINSVANFNLTLDPQMLALNKQGFYNGHVPFSSCLAFASFIIAYLNNKQYIVLSNEASANEGNIPGSDVNHQYSKSIEFENDFRAYTAKYLTDKISYFSLLRCLNEYGIVRRFVRFPLYLDVFRSCNVGLRHNKWCGHCAKCLYVFIMLYPFVSTTKLTQIFGHNLLDDINLAPLLTGLIHPETIKPFECVGTKEEVAYALEQGINQKGELNFALVDYYVKNLRVAVPGEGIEHYFNPEHNIPDDYLELIKK